MTTSRLMAGASRFAHFAGLSRASIAAADDDDDTNKDEARADDGEDDGDEEEPKAKKGKAKRAAADDSDDGEEEPKGKKSKRAAEDDGDDEEPKSKKSKAKRAADDDDDDDAEDDDDKREMTGNSAVANARLRERQRCAAILSSPHAATNPALAASLACETTMTRQEAILVMKGQAGRTSSVAPARSPREARNPDLGGNGGESGKKPAGSSWERSFARLGIQPAKR